MFDIFIRRPILSLVISVFLVLLGGLALYTLPITQFPRHRAALRDRDGQVHRR
jgi:multidrug efflux pump subunit AcrB